MVNGTVLNFGKRYKDNFLTEEAYSHNGLQTRKLGQNEDNLWVIFQQHGQCFDALSNEKNLERCLLKIVQD